MTTSVLIVEDEPSILELISYTCRTSGMEVRKAANVAEAKKNLEAAKPDIILLDEPTSNLDSLNEGIILKAVRDECREKTVLLVSHRKSTMAVADVSFSVESGRLS